jgi:eukaryotic-like serine/threonine-protein kinase
MSLLRDGQSIRDTYEVECLLGEGAFGEVYRVRHAFLGKQAMKVFKIVGLSLDETMELLSEAILLSKMSHPNIVHVFDANTVETSKGQCSFFTMEYVAGGTLDRFWRSHNAQFVPIEKSVDIVRQICRGLVVAHSERPPIIHRDIKPQNILVGYDSVGLRVRISDFGLAKRVNPLTLAATAAGTPSFKAPEVFSDAKADSTAGDVWSVGVVLYLLLTDRFPYSHSGEAESNNTERFKKPLALPSRFNCLVDTKLDHILRRALAQNHKERIPNAMEFLRALDDWQIVPPDATSRTHSSLGSDASKSALGAAATSQDEEEGTKMAARAIELAQQASQLQDAADLMEEAFNKWPELRGRYERRVKLWRCGIITPTRDRM